MSTLGKTRTALAEVAVSTVENAGEKGEIKVGVVHSPTKDPEK